MLKHVTLTQFLSKFSKEVAQINQTSIWFYLLMGCKTIAQMKEE